MLPRTDLRDWLYCTATSGFHSRRLWQKQKKEKKEKKE
jgi:hypothetical protein